MDSQSSFSRNRKVEQKVPTHFGQTRNEMGSVTVELRWAGKVPMIVLPVACQINFLSTAKWQWGGVTGIPSIRDMHDYISSKVPLPSDAVENGYRRDNLIAEARCDSWGSVRAKIEYRLTLTHLT
ncbi:hypothetical protein V8E54_005938 [Elaphomyces granulatus]